jgi:ABC-type branched-subunit amino acid transport system substrate-binding protein
VALNCSAPSLNNLIFSCTTDADCTGGKVCAQVNGVLGCVAPGTVTDGGLDGQVGDGAPDSDGSNAAAIHLGMSAAFTGTSGSLGTEMRRGIEAYLKTVNDKGGVLGGRHVVLDALDDHYDPATAVLNTEQLLDMPSAPLLADGAVPTTPTTTGPKSVFAVIGNVGTPPMVDTFPIITGARVIFFAPFTGSQKYLRDGTNSPYEFNFRAGYYDETQAMVDYFFKKRSPALTDYKHVIVFAQKDTYGDAGYNGIVNGYTNSVGTLPAQGAITRINYTRDDLTSVPPAVQQTITWSPDSGTSPAYNLESIYQDAVASSTVQSVVIVMIDTYAIGAQYIKGVKDYIYKDASHSSLLDVSFVHVSFVGPDTLAASLQTLGTVTGSTKTYADGVMVTQVVPFYNSQSPGVVQYRADIKAFDQGAYNSTSLEGYLAADLFVAGLKQTSAVDSDSVVKAFENNVQNVDLGIGVLVGFSPTNHQASHNVWLSQLDASANYSFPYRWDPTNKIQPN